MRIIEKNNRFIEEFEKASKGGKRIFIFGGGSGARIVYEKVCKSDGRNIPVEAFVLNDDYYDLSNMREMLGLPVIPVRDLDRDDPNIFVGLGYSHYDYFDNDPVIPTMKGFFACYDLFSFFDKSGTKSYLDYDFCIQNVGGLREIYDSFADQKSKDVMDAYLNQRISGKFDYLKEFKDDDQYYNDEVVDLSRIENIVDCGAYNGDSFERFRNNFEQRTGEKYMGQAWLWEAESKNVDVLINKYADDKNVHVIGIGAGKEKAIVKFGGEGTAGSIGAGDDEIEIDSIDHIVGGKVNFIKMDIEGAEYDALLGARDTICRDKPVLAICVYHKRDDLLTIPKLIRSFSAEYRFYLRAYSRHSSEIVLYAVI